MEWLGFGSGGGRGEAARSGAAGAAAGPPPDFVYGRVSADSDDEEAGPPQPGHAAARARQPRSSAPGELPSRSGGAAPSSGGGGAQQAAARAAAPAARAPSASGPLPQLADLLGDEPAADAQPGQRGPSHHSSAAGPAAPGPGSSGAAGGGGGAAAGGGGHRRAGSFSELAAEARGADGGLTAEQQAYGEALAAAAAHGDDCASGGSSGDEGGGSPSHADEKRELIIYALPLTREKIAFMPVLPWRAAPPPDKPAPGARPQAAPGLGGFVRARVAAALEDAAGVWEGMKEAEEGSIKNRLYRFGQRVLDGISAEERLMAALPKRVSRVIIRHATRAPPDALAAQLSTMTSAYGVKAVGKAAVATVMLPLAIGVDLIILPGPQVLTYYTSWQLYRNAKGAVGSQRAAFVTQAGGGADIRVQYVPDARLDAAHDALDLSRDGVLPDEAIDALVATLREPSLEEPLRELRRQRLRKLGRAAGDGGGRYTPLAAAQQAD